MDSQRGAFSTTSLIIATIACLLAVLSFTEGAYAAEAETAALPADDVSAMVEAVAADDSTPVADDGAGEGSVAPASEDTSAAEPDAGAGQVVEGAMTPEGDQPSEEGASAGAVADDGAVAGQRDQAADSRPIESENTQAGAASGCASGSESSGASSELAAVTQQASASATSTSQVKPAASTAAKVPAKAADAPDVVVLKQAQEPPAIVYAAHVANKGWLDPVSNAKVAGSSSAGLQVEALQLHLENVKGAVTYQVLVTGKGWTGINADGFAGTTGKSLSIQAIRARLWGEAANLYELIYRVYVDDCGWLGWSANYAIAGTNGFDRAVEGVQFKLMKKGTATPVSASSVTKVPYITVPNVQAKGYVQSIGWQKAVGNGGMVGTSGKALRVEAFRINVNSAKVAGGASYDAHVQNVGWQKPVGNNQVAGTTGKNQRVEAMHLNLTGDMQDCYDVFYRVHVQNYGWLDWATAKQMAGSEGRALRIEALEVYVTLRGGEAPGSTVRPALNNYVYLDAGHGWSGAQGYDSGALGKGYTEAVQTKELVGKIAEYCRGFGLLVYDNSTAGAPGVNFRDRQADAQARGCSMFVSIHFNASGSGKGTGTESYAYTTRGKALQSILHPYLTKGTGLYDRGAKAYGYTVLCGELPATLCEICFIDNPSDMKAYKVRENEVARQLALGIYEASKQGF